MSIYRNLCFLMVLIMGFSSNACSTTTIHEAGCNAWFSETIKAVESTSVENRYQKTLELLAQGCKVVPLTLREAAQRSLNKTGVEQKAILLKAAAPYFSESCIPENPDISASKLLHICLGSDYPNGEFSSISEKIDAATYMYGKALQKEFEKAGCYEKYGRRILLNFFLSNAIARETE